MKLYFKFFAMHLKSRMAYKKSFFFSVIGQFLTSFTAFLSLYFLLNRFQSVKGYTMGDCLLSASIMWIAFPIAEWFFRSAWGISWRCTARRISPSAIQSAILPAWKACPL